MADNFATNPPTHRQLILYIPLTAFDNGVLFIYIVADGYLRYLMRI